MDADLLVLSPKLELVSVYARGTEIEPA
jgi:hypothetical protein